MTAPETKVLLVTGGCRSGKSSYAQAWAEDCASNRLFVATAVPPEDAPEDEEMLERIRRHKEARGPSWSLVEEPVDLKRVLSENGSDAGVILIDCITVWVSNLMLSGLSDEAAIEKAEALVEAFEKVSCPVVMVTNEVGWGVVPETPLGRRFRDLAGSVNQVLAAGADRVVLMVSGFPLQVK